jgi:hypothetical protein
MSKTLPPAEKTVRGDARLRAAFLALALVWGLAAPLSARTAPVKVLIYAPVSDAARGTMSATLWAKMVSDYVNARTVPFTDHVPTLDDCRQAGADFMATAPFDLRPRLPGMPNSSGRVGAMSHLTFTNCITGTVVYDQIVTFESDPQASGSEGDFDTVPEIAWSKNVPVALAKYPVYFPRVSRVIQVTPPLALVDLRGEVKPGDQLRIYAGSDRKPKGPIMLTVTQLQGKYTEVMFSTVNGSAPPSVGDYVEPAPPAKTTP